MFFEMGLRSQIVTPCANAPVESARGWGKLEEEKVLNGLDMDSQSAYYLYQKGIPAAC